MNVDDRGRKAFSSPSAQAYCKLLQQLFNYNISPYSRRNKWNSICVDCVCVCVCCFYFTKTKKIFELVISRHVLAWYKHMENPRKIHNDNCTNIWWQYSLGPFWAPVTNTHSHSRSSKTSDNQWQSKNSSYQRINVITFEQF